MGKILLIVAIIGTVVCAADFYVFLNAKPQLLNNIPKIFVQTVNSLEKGLAVTVFNLKIQKANAMDLVRENVQGLVLGVEDEEPQDVNPPSYSGITDGETYSQPITLIFHDAEGLATAFLDGAQIESGTVIDTEGSHSIIISDTAGNSVNLSFTIALLPPPEPEITVTELPDSEIIIPQTDTTTQETILTVATTTDPIGADIDINTTTPDTIVVVATSTDPTLDLGNSTTTPGTIPVTTTTDPISDNGTTTPGTIPVVTNPPEATSTIEVLLAYKIIR